MSSATHILTSEQTINFLVYGYSSFQIVILYCYFFFFRMLSRISLATSSRRDRTCHLPQHLSSGVNNNYFNGLNAVQIYNLFNHCSNEGSTNPLPTLNSWLALNSHCSNEGSTNPLPPLNSWLALNSHCSNEGFTSPLNPLNSWLALNSNCSNEGSTNPSLPSIPGWL